MIVVEGPDGAGKTTLVRQLKRDFPQLRDGERGVADRSKLYTVTRPDTYNAFRLMLEPISRPRIWDRLYWSELVYSPMMDRPIEFNRAEQSFFEALFEGCYFPVILCMPPAEVCRKNLEANDQMTGVKENIETLWISYEELFPRFPKRTLYYDYTGTNFNTDYELVHAIVDIYLGDRRERTR